MVEPQVFDNII